MFRAGNIATHAIQRAFVEDLTADGQLQLPWHLARKQIDGMGPDGVPARIDGVKFETFVFDALARARSSVTLEVERGEEFSPVKNAEGMDSPASCRVDLTRLFAGWLTAAGIPAAPTARDGLPHLEVDPRFAEDAAEFAARLPATPVVLGEGHLYR